jgi:hypothetical protein
MTRFPGLFDLNPRLKRLGWVLACSVCCLGWCSAATAETPALPAPTASAGAALGAQMPACRTSVRLTAVLHDPSRAERSFAIVGLASEQRTRVVRRGTHIAGYELTRIEQSGVVLAAEAGSCSLRLQGAVAEHELRTIPVATVRSQLRARKAAHASAERMLPSDMLARRGE